MSHFPNSVIKRAGYKTTNELRDSKEKNPRYKCPLCPREGLLFTSYGLHILKEHPDLLFGTDSKDSEMNRSTIQKRSYLTKPIPLAVGSNEEKYACLGCLTVFHSLAKADSHFNSKEKVCGSKHKENLEMLRDKYPQDMEKAKLNTSLPKKAQLQNLVEDLIEQVRMLEHKLNESEPFDYEGKYGRYFNEWGMDLKEETLKPYWLFCAPPREAPPSEPEEEDVPLLVQPKAPTKEEFIQLTMTAKDFEECSKNVLTGQIQTVPELEALKTLVAKPAVQAKPKRGPKKVEATEPVVSTAQTKSYDDLLAEMDAFKKMTPWERLMKANPTLSLDELKQEAEANGIPCPL